VARSFTFTDFRIQGLRGSENVHVQIRDNTLILVGENGSGKTTFLRILFGFLSGRWSSLMQFDFQSLTARIDGESYFLQRSDIETAVQPVSENILNALPPQSRRRVTDLIASGRYLEAEEYLSNFPRLIGVQNLENRRKLSLETFEYSSKVLLELKNNISQSIDSQILYLPTYRRIERELNSILRGGDPDEGRPTPRITRQPEDGLDYIELVEFGMNDVKKAIDVTLEQIRAYQLQGTTHLSLSYLGDVFSRKYQKPDHSSIANAKQNIISAVLNRIDSTILSGYDKSRLESLIKREHYAVNELSEHEKIVYHYFTKLIRFQEDLEVQESNIKSFCRICSEYIKSKEFVYESGKFSFGIIQKGNQANGGDAVEGTVQLSDLSSGEKQIVSLFSHLYLSGRQKYFVLIDEPELSLSVPWQRRFLSDIRNASFCAGLIAVTHSPFIYDNELRQYASSIGEFISGPDWGGIQ
jgi:ABC-type Mn2+/Zn2+ transport system ATPase subunit